VEEWGNGRVGRVGQWESGIVAKPEMWKIFLLPSSLLLLPSSLYLFME
jgi:hypothetical protein